MANDRLVDGGFDLSELRLEEAVGLEEGHRGLCSGEDDG